MKPFNSMVVWITGLAGAGKTTMAREIIATLRKEGPNILHLDGDDIREALGNDLGHSHEERLKNAFRLCRLAKLFSDQQQLVICSTMSLYPEIWEWNRSNFARYLQVYLRVDQKTLRERDKKNLYSKGSVGDIHVIGRDLPFNEPLDSELVLINDNEATYPENVKTIIDWIRTSSFQPT